MAEMVIFLWSKEYVLADGKATGLDLDTRLEGLEVFVFLCMFRLSKILPCHRVTS